MSEARVLWSLGWIKAFDIVVIAVSIIATSVILAWFIFAKPDPVLVVASFIPVLILLQIWLAMLIFRSSYFVLKMRAEFEMLPDAAARIAVAHMQGGAGQAGS